MRTITLMCCFALAAAASLSAQVANTPPSRPRVSAQQHLQDAQEALSGMPETVWARHAAKAQSQLTQDFSALVASYGAGQQSGGAWTVIFASVERDVVRLIGGGGPGIESDEAPGALRVSRPELLGPDAGGPLSAFRTDLELFYDAATTGLPVLTSD